MSNREFLCTKCFLIYNCDVNPREKSYANCPNCDSDAVHWTQSTYCVYWEMNQHDKQGEDHWKRYWFSKKHSSQPYTDLYIKRGYQEKEVKYE